MREKKTTEKTLYVLVTCSRDKVRDELVTKVVDSIEDFPKENLIAFDNYSSFEGTKEKLRNSFKNCIFSQNNYGFWSAVNWCIQNYKNLLEKELEYVYVIESDAVHWENHLPALVESENYLEETQDVGSVRLQEFSIENRHLYDKGNTHPQSRKWAWIRQSNHFTKEKAYFSNPVGNIYRSNIVPQVCALNRIDFMRNCFDELKKMTKFSEIDFQSQYFKTYKETCVYNGGIFDTRISFESDTLNGSWSDKTKLKNHGYRMTREDVIEDVDPEKFVNSEVK